MCVHPASAPPPAGFFGTVFGGAASRWVSIRVAGIGRREKQD